MRELIDSFLQNGLADFEGLQVTGTIPIKTELINDLIADFLKPGDPEPAPAAPVVAPTEPPPPAPVATAPKPKRPSLEKLLKPLIRRVAVNATDGKIVLEFEFRR